MSEPLDVALRVKLAYEAAGARAAVGDLEAIRAGAARLAGAAGGAKLAADVGAIARPAQIAKAELAATTAAAEKLGAATKGIASGDGLSILSREAVEARRALGETAGAVERLAAAPPPDRLAAAMRRAADEAAAAERAVDALLASAGELSAWSPAQAEAALKTFDRQVKSGRVEIGAMEEAAGKVGRGAGPAKLASSVAAISPAATEARRHIDDIGTAARTAERDLARMGRAAAEGGGAGGGGATGGGGGGHGGGGGGGGLRGALIAGARPLRMERLVMSAMSPVGLAGLAGGLGVAAIGRGLKSITDEAIGFESAMVEVRRAVGDMPDAGVKHLGETILGVSRATGTSSTELAAMAAAATRAGRPVADLQRFLDLGAKSANVMGMSVEEAGQKLVQLGRSWGKDEAGLEDTADAVTLLAKRTGAKAGNVLDIVNANPDMRERGMTARQVAAFGATFEAQGAGGSFRGFADKLANPQNAGQGFETGLHQLEIGPSQARVGMRTDPTRLMTEVLDKLKALPDVQRVPMLERMFGPDGGRDIGRVVDHLDDLKSALGLVENAAQRNGALEKSFKLFDDTTRAKIDRASAAMGAFAVKVGQELAPAVGKAAEATERLFNAMSAALEKGDRLAQAAAIAPKVGRGEALTPDQNKALEVDPALKADVDRKAAIVDEASERQRQSRLAGIRALQEHARKKGDASVGSALRDQAETYRRDFPNAPDPLAPNPAAGGTARAPHDQHGSLLDPSMIHRASYIEGDPMPSGGSSATDALRAVLASATKEGVVEGLREVLDMRGGGTKSSGIVPASYEDVSDGGSEDAGGGRARNMRYGRASAGAALPNLRYGRSSGGFRNTPAGRARGAYRGGHSGRAPGSGGGAYGSGWVIGSGDGSATTQDSGAGFTSGMRARNLGNIGYFGQHEPGLVGPSNSHDVDHSIALYASQEDGIRSAARLALRKYQGGMHNTWDMIAGRPENGHATLKGAWTPGSLGGGASENIAKAMGLSNRDDLHLDDPGQMRKFLSGLAHQEHGSAGSFYTPEMIDRALKGGGPASNAARAADQAGTDRRGFANLMHGQYGEPGQNLTSITTEGGHKATVHAAAADSFRGFLGDLEKSGYNINSLGGYANRGMAGNASRISQHAYGNAIDINPQQNPFHTSQTDLPRNVSSMAAKWGLSWGGDWSERSRDPMHFEWNGSRPWENKQGPAATAQNKPSVMPFGLTGSALEAMDKARAAKAQAAVEDRASRSTAAERQAAAQSAPMLSPRASAPKLVPRTNGPMTTASAAGGAQSGGAAPAVQNFYGMHDPKQTARMAMMEQNREVRRSQARALHSVGRVA